MKINKEKFETFLEIAKNLNHFLNITPIVYGSLGLYRIIGERGKCDPRKMKYILLGKTLFDNIFR